jgi:peptidyl-prolyl cis-trans isomerase SurA
MRTKLIWTLAWLGLATASFAQKAVIDKVVAMVGGEVILLSEVEEQYALMKAQRPNTPTDARCDMLDGLLTAKLLINQAKLDSIEVSDQEVEDQLNARIDRILSYMNGDVAQFEDYYGQTITQVKEQFREDLRNQLLADRMRGEVLKSVTVTPSEVKVFFDQIPRDSLPYFNSEVEVGEIVGKPQVNAAERQRAIDKLEGLRAQVVGGQATFEALAQRFSDDGSARIGGDLGWAKRGKFVPDFEAAAYNLEPGEISSVVETEFGFHLIQLIERRGNSIHVRHILVRPNITNDDLELTRRQLDSVRALVLADSMSFSIAVKRFGYKEVQSYTNDGRMMNPVSGNTFFEIGDLEPDVYFALDTMKRMGSISAPFEFKDPTGETYFRIVQLQSRSAPHRANLKQDYAKIRDAAIQSKQNEHLMRWVAERIQNTYIYIDPMYNVCPGLSIWQKNIDRP